MKVVFKLTNEQVKVANSVAAQVNNDVSVDPNDIYCGNLLGYMYNHQNFNRNQWLQFNEDAATVEFNGERHHEGSDDAMDVLKKISNEDIKKLRVVLYETSDKRLHWYETLHDYLLDRATPADTAKDVAEMMVKWGYGSNYYGPETIARNFDQYTRRHGVYFNHIVAILNGSDRRLAAELNKDQMALLRAIRGAYVK